MPQYLLDDQMSPPQPAQPGANSLLPWQQTFMRSVGRHPVELGIKTPEQAERYMQIIRRPVYTMGIRG